MIKVDTEKCKIQVNGKQEKNESEFAILVGVLCELYGVEEVKKIFNIGIDVYTEDGSVLTKKNRKIEKYEIKANNRRSAIKQLKALELPKFVEKAVIEEILKD